MLRGIQRITIRTKEPFLEFMFASEDVPASHTHFVAEFDRLLHVVSLVACLVSEAIVPETLRCVKHFVL